MAGISVQVSRIFQDRRSSEQASFDAELAKGESPPLRHFFSDWRSLSAHPAGAKTGRVPLGCSSCFGSLQRSDWQLSTGSMICDTIVPAHQS